METIRNTSRRKLFILVLLCCSFALILQYWSVTEHIDRMLYDMQMPLWSESAPDDVVIIAIDDKSIAKTGRWPWSRRVHAQLIDKLTEYNTGLIIFNVLFSEPDKNNTSHDDAFAQSIADNGKVILSVAGTASSSHGDIQELLPIPKLYQAAYAVGHTDLELDIDNTFRRTFLYAGHNGARWPGLAVAALSMNGATCGLLGQHNHAPKIRRNNTWVRDYCVMVPFTGGQKHFKRFSYVDVLEGKIPASELSEKYIFIGSTAKGLGSHYPIPLRSHNKMSGIEIQANIFQALRSHKTIQEICLPLKVCLTFILTLFGSLLIIRNNWAKSPFYLSVILAVIILSGLLLLHFTRIFFPIAPIGISLIITALTINWFHLTDLQEAATTDGLTGLSNRRSFDHNFDLLWRLGRRYKLPFSLLLIDVDYFKKYNDSYGHYQGDNALKQVSKVLQKHVRRAGEEVCRIGGEEFVVLISNCNLEKAHQYAEQLRTAIEALAIKHNDSKISDVLTVSIGVATTTPTLDKTKENLFKSADKVLYKAKDLGRNQVCSVDMDAMES